MSRESLEEALGSGVNFPEIFNKATGTTRIEEGREKIKQSIQDILGVRVGEEFGNPEYGSRLYEVLFEQNDYMARDLAKDYIIDALDRWEDRIVVEDIIVNIEGHEMEIRIEYRISRTNIRDYYEQTLMREVG